MPKLFVLQKGLALRARHGAAFGPAGTYESLIARGNRADHVVAFVRGGEAITIVPRLVMTLAGRWDNTVVDLPPRGRWTNVMTGDSYEDEAPLSDVLAAFPVALLERAKA
jgi:(1->4)-alpha-D-glucan 1-alpha-D-glucosylmutase